jgi:tetratricopeptide (TPR) repeat protein
LIALAVLASAALACSVQSAQGAGFDSETDSLARAWAHVNYEIKDPRAEAVEAERLAARAGALAKKSPGRAEPLAWQALALLSDADAKHDLRSLEIARTARHLLERAAKIDPNAIGDGTIYANLGSLYAQVPGFPLGFGDAGRAQAYFDKALAANPSGLDANYFYGDFLYRQGDTAKAIQTLEKAIAAPARPGRELADSGRKWEARELLAKIRRKMKDGDGRERASTGGRRS